MKPTQPPTHLALPLPIAKAVRQTLGVMPHDQVRDLLAAFDNSPTVTLNAPTNQEEDKAAESNDGEPVQRH